MINIFYMVHSLTSGGIEKFSINLFKYIDKNNIKIDFITKMDRPEFFDNELKRMGGTKIPLIKPNENKIMILLRMIRLIRSKKYDIFYFNLSKPTDVWKYPLVCKLMGCDNIVIHSHNSSTDSSISILNNISRYFINKISRDRFACSPLAAKWMFGKKIEKEHDYVYVKNGIDVDKYNVNKTIRARMRSVLGISNETVVIGHIGRFEKQKNHYFLINILKKMIDSNQDVFMILIGTGSLEKDIKKRAKELNIYNYIYFAGEQSNINDWLQVFDIFVLPSLYEGLPVVGIEAQASGLQCLFSNNITVDVNITGNCTFLPLNIDDWIYEINKVSNHVRHNVGDQVKKAGYDMKDVAQLIQCEMFNLLN